jgi:hypothetical protein
MAQGHDAYGVDAVGANPPVFALGSDRGCGFGGCLVGLGRGAAVERSVGSFVVVDVAELGQQLVQVGEGVGFGLGAEPFLQGLVEALDFALGLGVAGVSVLLGDPEGCQEVLEGVASAASAGRRVV